MTYLLNLRFYWPTSHSTLILTTYGSLWPFLISRQFRKLQNSRTKYLSSRLALLIPTVSTSTFHSTNIYLFLFSHHHIPTNSIAPLSGYKPTHNSQFLRLLWWRAITQNFSFLLLRWQIYVVNSVVNTKLPAILSHRCSTTVSLETHPIYS